MPYINFNFCPNIRLTNYFCIKKNEENILDFDLLKNEKKNFKNLLPSNNNFLYFKILPDYKVIACSGDLMKFFNIKEKDVLNKNIEDIKKCQVFFNDFLVPLLDSSLEKMEAYEFDFKTNKKNYLFTCSLYPCSLPNVISSFDIVIRRSTKNNILNTGNFAIKSII